MGKNKEEVLLYDVRHQSQEHYHWADDYLIPTRTPGAVNQDLFVFNMARRPYQLTMYGIKKLSDDYGGNKVVGLSISQPVSFLVNFAGEHFRHPGENNWQHLGRAALRTGFDYAAAQVIPGYKTLTFAAEVANHYWQKFGGTQELYKFENLVFDDRFVNDVTGHLGASVSEQTKRDLALVWGNDLFEGRREALQQWQALANIHKLKGAIVNGLGNILFVRDQPLPPVSSSTALEARALTIDSELSPSAEPLYDFSEYNPRQGVLADLQADYERNPGAVQAMVEQLFCPPQRTLGDFLEDHVRVKAVPNGFSVEIGTKGFWDNRNDILPETNLGVSTISMMNNAYAKFDAYMEDTISGLEKARAKVLSLSEQINLFFENLSEPDKNYKNAFVGVEQQFENLKKEIKKLDAKVVEAINDRDKSGFKKPFLELGNDPWGDDCFEVAGLLFPRIREYGRLVYGSVVDGLRKDLDRLKVQYYDVKLVTHYNAQSWDEVVSTFKKRYGGIADISRVNMRDRLIYAIAQQKTNGSDLPVVMDLINKACQANIKNLGEDENLSLLKQYTFGVMQDENMALENIAVIKFCFEKALSSGGSEFWLRSLSNLYMIQGQPEQSELLFKRWISCHPNDDNIDELKFILGRIQYAIGHHAEADETIASIKDYAMVDEAVLALYRLPLIEVIEEDAPPSKLSSKKLTSEEASSGLSDDEGIEVDASPDSKQKSHMTQSTMTEQESLRREKKNTLVGEEMLSGKAKKAQLIDGMASGPKKLKKQKKSTGFAGSLATGKRKQETQGSQTDEGFVSASFRKKLSARVLRQLSAESKKRQSQVGQTPTGLPPTLPGSQPLADLPPTSPGSQSDAGPAASTTGTGSSAKKPTIVDSEIQFQKKLVDFDSFSRQLNELLDNPESKSGDLIGLFLKLGIDQALSLGCFDDFHAKFLACVSSSQIEPNDVKQYVNKLVEGLEGHLKILDENSDPQSFIKHINIVNDTLLVISRNRALFTERQISQYAGQFDQYLKNSKYSDIENIDVFRLSAEKILSNSNERIELQIKFNRSWHERGMQVAEITQYLLDKIHKNFPDYLPENYYLVLDSSVECWSRIHEVLSNESGVISCDSVFSILAGISILARNFFHYRYSDVQSRINSFHRFHGESEEDANKRFSQLMDEHFERFQCLVIVDICAVATGTLASREFFLGLGKNGLSTTGLLYLSHYVGRAGYGAYKLYQESTLRSTGRYDESVTAATLGGIARGFAENPFMQNRVMVGAGLSFLSRINLAPHIIWGSSKTLTGMATQALTKQLISRGFVEKGTIATAGTVLSSAASTVLIGMNIATAALLAHSAVEYGTLIYGDNKLSNLVKQVEEAEKIEKEATAFASSTDPDDQAKADALFAQAKVIYQETEKAFAASDYSMDYSEQLNLKQELGRLHAKLAHIDSEKAGEVFDEALEILSKDEMFNKEKSWFYQYVGTDAHSVYRDSEDRHVPKFARLAGRAFLRLTCTLVETCADKIASFEKETGEIFLTEKEKEEVHGIADAMKLHMLQGETNDFVKNRPAGLYVFDDQTKKLKVNGGIRRDRKKLSDDINAVRFHREKHDASKQILQATANLHFGRFVPKNEHGQPLSASSFISGRFADMYAHLMGRDPSYHQEHKAKYSFFSWDLAPAFSAKKAKFDLFFADLSLRVLMHVMNRLFRLVGFSEESLIPRGAYAALGFLKEYILNNIMEKIREWSNAPTVEGWQAFLQKSSFLTRVGLPFLSLCLPSMNSAVNDPRRALFMAAIIGIILLLNGFSLFCFASNLPTTGAAFSTNSVTCFLGVMFTSHLLVSQLLPILQYISQLNFLACALGHDEEGMNQAKKNYLSKTIQFFRDSMVFSLMNVLSSIYYFCNMHSLNEVSTTYERSESASLWLTQPFVFFVSECLAFFTSNFDVASAAALAFTLIAIYLIKAVADISQDRVQLPKHPSPDHSANWMSYIKCLTSFNLWSFFNGGKLPEQKSSLPEIRAEMPPVYAQPGESATHFSTAGRRVPDLSVNPNHVDIQFVAARSATIN